MRTRSVSRGPRGGGSMSVEPLEEMEMGMEMGMEMEMEVDDAVSLSTPFSAAREVEEGEERERVCVTTKQQQQSVRSSTTTTTIQSSSIPLSFRLPAASLVAPATLASLHHHPPPPQATNDIEQEEEQEEREEEEDDEEERGWTSIVVPLKLTSERSTTLYKRVTRRTPPAAAAIVAYTCTYPLCEWSTTPSHPKRFRAHLRSHLLGEAFKCFHCRRKFVDAVLLEVHGCRREREKQESMRGEGGKKKRRRDYLESTMMGGMGDELQRKRARGTVAHVGGPPAATAVGDRGHLQSLDANAAPPSSSSSSSYRLSTTIAPLSNGSSSSSSHAHSSTSSGSAAVAAVGASVPTAPKASGVSRGRPSAKSRSDFSSTTTAPHQAVPSSPPLSSLPSSPPPHQSLSSNVIIISDSPLKSSELSPAGSSTTAAAAAAASLETPPKKKNGRGKGKEKPPKIKIPPSPPAPPSWRLIPTAALDLTVPRSYFSHDIALTTHKIRGRQPLMRSSIAPGMNWSMSNTTTTTTAATAAAEVGVEKNMEERGNDRRADEEDDGPSMQWDGSRPPGEEGVNPTKASAQSSTPLASTSTSTLNLNLNHHHHQSTPQSNYSKHSSNASQISASGGEDYEDEEEEGEEEEETRAGSGALYGVKWEKTRGDNGKPMYCCGEGGCNKVFKRLEHLKRHVKIHSKIKPYQCPFPGCGRYFARNDNLKQHTKVHGESTLFTFTPTTVTLAPDFAMPLPGSAVPSHSRNAAIYKPFQSTMVPPSGKARKSTLPLDMRPLPHLAAMNGLSPTAGVASTSLANAAGGAGGGTPDLRPLPHAAVGSGIGKSPSKLNGS